LVSKNKIFNFLFQWNMFLGFQVKYILNFIDYNSL
jgi:hypothetical protein